MGGTLPSNVDDPQFAAPIDDPPGMRAEAEPDLYWPFAFLEALLEALPQVVERVLPR